MDQRLSKEFHTRDVLEVAPDLLGKKIMRRDVSGHVTAHIISETEAYRGIEDKACHASKGKTARTKVMYEQGGILYMYLIYGMYWMMNVVTGEREVPQAVLIRGLLDVSGPGRLTRHLSLDGSFNEEDLQSSGRIWIIDEGEHVAYSAVPRIGIDYAGALWKMKPWRYVMKQ